MELTIKINMDNEAFAGGGKHEVRRIVEELFNKTKFSDISFGNSKKLMDINGNSVGYAEITK